MAQMWGNTLLLNELKKFSLKAAIFTDVQFCRHVINDSLITQATMHELPFNIFDMLYVCPLINVHM